MTRYTNGICVEGIMDQFSYRLNGVTIRNARKSDVSSIAELKSKLDRIHRLPGLWPPEGGSSQYVLRYRKMLRQPIARVFVAERSPNGIIGYLTAFIQTRKCNERDFKRIGVIGEAFVEERHRNRGIGTALVQTASSFFSGKGVRHLTLRNAVGNETANRFWSNLAFNPVLYTRTTTLRDLNRALRKTMESS